MFISVRDDSLSWPVHALLYVSSCLLSHSQLVAGFVAHILRSTYIIGKRSSLHSLRALHACGIWPVFLQFWGVSERNKKQCVLFSFTYPFVEFVVEFWNMPELINLVNYVLPDLESKNFLTKVALATGDHLYRCWWSHCHLANHCPRHTALTVRDREGYLNPTKKWASWWGGKRKKIAIQFRFNPKSHYWKIAHPVQIWYG